MKMCSKAIGVYGVAEQQMSLIHLFYKIHIWDIWMDIVIFITENNLFLSMASFWSVCLFYALTVLCSKNCLLCYQAARLLQVHWFWSI